MQSKYEKYQHLEQLINDTLNIIVSDQVHWISFLNTAANMYKYSFDEQVLIHAQRPDTAACASFDFWTSGKKMNMQITKGAKGVALIDKTNRKLHYVYAVEDAVPKTDGQSRNPENYRWKMKDVKKQDVLEMIKSHYGVQTDNLAKGLITMASLETDKFISRYSAQLQEKANQLSIAFTPKLADDFKQLLQVSSAYIVLKRSGLDAEKLIIPATFNLMNRIDKRLTAVLGQSLNVISRSAIRQVETVVGLDLKKGSIENEQKNRDTVTEKDDRKWDSLHTGRENADLSPLPGREKAGNTDRQVWQNEREIPEGKQGRSVHGDAYDQHTNGASDPDRRTSLEQDRSDSEANGSKERANGGNQRERSAQMGGVDEQLQTDSRRNSDQGNDLHLENYAVSEFETSGTVFLSSDTQQLSLFGSDKTDNKSQSFFDDSVIEEIVTDDLLRGSGFADGKFRIYEYYESNKPSTKEFADFLKNEYGTGGHSGQGYVSSSSHDSKGIIFDIKALDGIQKVKLSWSNAAKRIESMISSKNYISESDRQSRIKQAQFILQFAKPEQTEKIEKAKKILESYKIQPYAADSVKTAESKADVSPTSESSDFYRIYQFKKDEKYHVVRFQRYKYLEDNNISVDISDFDFTYQGRLSDISGDTVEDKLNSIYIKFNINRPDDFKGHSISVSDVIVISKDKELTAYYVDTMGFPALTNFQSKDIAETRDYRLNEDDIIEGGAKTKFKHNVEAVKLLKKIESENRLASPEEQCILARYSGWGGLSQAFDSDNTKWTNEYQELKSLLTEKEYMYSRTSTLTSFFTSPDIITAMYGVLKKNNFTGGKILEPSMGIGNFFSLMPDDIKNNSHLNGVECDILSGRISKQLYQNADIDICGFEKTEFPDDLFDLAIGNVPFGGYELYEKRYNKHNFKVHDHFFAKALDKIRPGGIVAFITSKGTLDKKNPYVRKYLAQRAELVGAFRLPNNAFKNYAGTEATSDILFLQKRPEPIETEPDWVYLGKNEDGLPINQYFINNPQMILGQMVRGNKLYGRLDEDTTCIPYKDKDLKSLLKSAAKKIKFDIDKKDDSLLPVYEPETVEIPANLKNFSFAIINDHVYYRNGSQMQTYASDYTARIKAMINMRDTLRKLIDLELDNASDISVRDCQKELNDLYDSFCIKYGPVNSKINQKVFKDDASLPLLSSLEIIEKDKPARKAAVFYTRTINPNVQITHVDTSAEALAVSISQKACVDIDFMSELCSQSREKIIDDLKGVIFENPMHTDGSGNPCFETSDEYLSGNIRKKLDFLKENYPDIQRYAININALEIAMPKTIEAADIDVRLGATWIEPKLVQQFMYDTLHTPNYFQKSGIEVEYSPFTCEWQISGKSLDKSNILVNNKYGTARKNAYQLLEDCLNLRDSRVMDKVTKDDKEYSVVNPQATELAQEKQKLLQQEFKKWIFQDPDRRDQIVEKYNVIFNSTKPREYDGSHLNFVGMNNEITLREHQKNAVAHALYGGNTLFAHEVGAGKTFEMIAAAMEGKRLGLHNKSLIAVPNHLTEQMGSDFLTLYPNANILVATADDFKKENRKKLFAKIATGDFDAVIIGHSQLVKIPVSVQRQEEFIQNLINEIVEGVAKLKEANHESFQVKQMEKSKKMLEVKLDKLLNAPIRDDVIDFEQLGIDKLIIDEAHLFKNLFFSTKMRNISGISTNDNVQKTADLYMKCQYIDEITNGKGLIFATGTPISTPYQRLLSYISPIEATIGDFSLNTESDVDSRIIGNVYNINDGYSYFVFFFNGKFVPAAQRLNQRRCINGFLPALSCSKLVLQIGFSAVQIRNTLLNVLK